MFVTQSLHRAVQAGRDQIATAYGTRARSVAEVWGDVARSVN